MQLSNAVAGSQIAVNGTVIAHNAWSYHGSGTENFGVLNDVEGTLQLLGTFTSSTTPTWAMLVEGTTTYPYEEGRGEIMRSFDYRVETWTFTMADNTTVTKKVLVLNE